MKSLMGLYHKAEKLVLIDKERAQDIFSHIANIISEKTLADLSNSELQAAALSYMQMFILSKFADMDFAKASIKYFEILIERGECDSYLYDEYVFILEGTYQYEKAYYVLKNMLSDKSKKVIALKYLSSFVYAIEGLQTNNDCIEYKKQLIELCDDELKKNKLKEELKAMEKM